MAGGVQTTIGVLEAFSELGLRAGDDLSLVVCDDLPWLRVMRPRISVVTRDAEAMGREAAGLRARDDPRCRAEVRHALPTGYEPRETSLPPRRLLSMQPVPPEVVAASVAGASELEQLGNGFAPLRIPSWTRAQQADRWFEFWAAHTVGVRLRLRTSATRLRLDASVTLMVPVGESAPIFPACVVAEAGGVEVARAPLTAGPLLWVLPDGTWREDADHGAPSTSTSAATAPYARSSSGCRRTAPPSSTDSLRMRRSRLRRHRSGPRWLHHGSSNSECLEAQTPRQTWPQLAASALGLELDNFGLAGNAQLDPFVARTLAARPADVISLKLGVNNVNADSMRRRTFVPALHGFLDLVREGHPAVPMVVLRRS